MPRAAFVHFTPSSPGKPPPRALTAHLRGDDDARPVEAVKRQDLPRAIDYGSEPDRAQKVVSDALRERREAKTGGRPPIQNVKVLIAGPPPWESTEAWPLEKVDRWAKANVRWLRKILPPGTPLLVSRVHCDELSPHHHVSFPPVSPDHTGLTTLSWKRTQAYMADEAAGAPVKNSSRAQMTAIQSSYHRAVGRHLDLARGKVGARIQYAPLDRSVGAARRIANTAALLADEKRAREEAERRAAEQAAERRRAEQTAAAQQAAADAERKRADKTLGINRRWASAYEQVNKAADAEREQAAAQVSRYKRQATAAETRATTLEARHARYVERAESAVATAERRATAAEAKAKAERDRRAAAEQRTIAAEQRAADAETRASRAETRAADTRAADTPRTTAHRQAAERRTTTRRSRVHRPPRRRSTTDHHKPDRRGRSRSR